MKILLGVEWKFPAKIKVSHNNRQHLGLELHFNLLLNFYAFGFRPLCLLQAAVPCWCPPMIQEKYESGPLLLPYLSKAATTTTLCPKWNTWWASLIIATEFRVFKKEFMAGRLLINYPSILNITLQTLHHMNSAIDSINYLISSLIQNSIVRKLIKRVHFRFMPYDCDLCWASRIKDASNLC